MKNLILKRLVGFAFLTAVIPAWGATMTDSIYSNAPFIMDVSGGVIIGGGDALPGVDMQVVGNLKTEFPLYLGGEIGTFITTGRYSTAVVIPILAKIYTAVRLSPRSHFRIGNSIGPVIASTGGYSGSGLAVLVDPAIVVGLNGKANLVAQARFGFMGGEFVALPQVGVTFVL